MNIINKLVSRVMQGQLSKLDKLYQRHAGEECYIFGDGISLKWMDLHQFANLSSILSAMIIYHQESNKIKKDYVCITEPYTFFPFFPYRGYGKLQLLKNWVIKEYKKTVIQNFESLFLINISNYPVARFSNALFVSRWYSPPFDCKNPFRERGDSHNGTLRFQLSLAIFLGFKKAYLIGHDYTHFPSRSLHFYEKGKGILDGNRDFCREFIDYAKQYIDLVTVTLDGGSETMDSVTYRELTGMEPKFRENIEIVDRVKLESLATWKGYSIF